jgi:hypothetical protein
MKELPRIKGFCKNCVSFEQIKSFSGQAAQWCTWDMNFVSKHGYCFRFERKGKKWKKIAKRITK